MKTTYKWSITLLQHTTEYKVIHMTALMKYDQEVGKKAGGSDSLSEGGAHICTITSAICVQAKTQTHGIEFEVVTDGGQKARYLTVYYLKADNTQVAGGQSMLNAMMGLTNNSGLSYAQANRDGESVNYIPELEGKKIGLFLQKKLYTKNDQSEGYSFEIKVPFNPVDGKTLREALDNKPAQTIERMSNSYKDKDERKAAQSNTQSGADDYGMNPPPGY